jgi:hypothetical protein
MIYLPRIQRIIKEKLTKTTFMRPNIAIKIKQNPKRNSLKEKA